MATVDRYQVGLNSDAAGALIARLLTPADEVGLAALRFPQSGAYVSKLEARQGASAAPAGTMLRQMTRASRWRMAAMFALAYLLCVLAPPIALAFMDSTSAYHCLTTRHQHGAAAQVHDAKTHISRATAHEHGGNSANDHGSHHDHGQNNADTEGVAVNCCGYFCLSAMPASPVPDCVPTIRVVSVAIAIEDGIAGRGPDRIERPPNVLLPL